MLLLVTVVYYPAGHLLARVATPQRFNLAAPPFQAGDVVLVNPSAYRWSDPQPGDVVYYRLLASRHAGAGAGPAGMGRSIVSRATASTASSPAPARK